MWTFLKNAANNLLRRGIRGLERFISGIIAVIVLAYPLKFFWNEIATAFSLPAIGHIDVAVAILAVVFILGRIFRN